MWPILLWPFGDPFYLIAALSLIPYHFLPFHIWVSASEIILCLVSQIFAFFLQRILREKRETGSDLITMDRIKALAVGCPQVRNVVDALNHDGLLIKKGPGRYKIETDWRQRPKFAKRSAPISPLFVSSSIIDMTAFSSQRSSSSLSPSLILINCFTHW